MPKFEKITTRQSIPTYQMHWQRFTSSEDNILMKILLHYSYR